MKCNIDARGKAVRLRMGLITTAIGLGLIVLDRLGVGPGPGGWPMWMGFGAMIAGGFAIFEGWAGWCAVRALGFQTRV
ncbi:MAG: hypothetical protein AB8G96_12410 [Phycisphaerales bacterium]